VKFEHTSFLFSRVLKKGSAMNNYRVTQFGLAALVLCCMTRAIYGAALTSAPFSFAYGFTGANGGSWNDSETMSTNTPTTQGSFSFAPAPEGERFSSDGVSFVNRILTDERAGNGFSGYISDPFLVSVTASYTGAAPMNASATPNYRLNLIISKISIYGGEHPDSESEGTMVWDETTPDHASTSPPVTLIESRNYNEAAFYSHVVWDPADFEQPLSGLNDSFTRTFDIFTVGGGGDLRFVDGLEIEGLVSLVYDAEPGGLPGDYNHDGAVNGADLDAWKSQFGGSGALGADGDADGDVDGADFLVWQRNLGAGAGLASAVAAVPEPSAWLIVLGGAGTLIARRPRRGERRHKQV
jgi:hypothetical protein